MRILMMAAATATLLAACASEPATDGTKVASAESGKICKSTTATGSNMPTRVCSTKAEWDKLDKQGQRGVDDFESAKETATTPGGVLLGN